MNKQDLKNNLYSYAKSEQSLLQQEVQECPCCRKLEAKLKQQGEYLEYKINILENYLEQLRKQ